MLTKNYFDFEDKVFYMSGNEYKIVYEGGTGEIHKNEDEVDNK